ncbi:MAG: hypothetical protein Q8O59_02145, partial [bacterium]|nr:hypothetical protein [bacterium]
INSAIIGEYKLSAKLRIVNDRNKINALKDNNVQSFTANAYLQIEKSEKCNHENTYRTFLSNGEVYEVCNKCNNTIEFKTEEGQIKKPLDHQPLANCYLALTMGTVYKPLDIRNFNY